MDGTLGKLLTCKRCGKVHFLKYTGTRSLSGGYEHIDDFEEPPKGWKHHIETGTLCDDCEKEYQALLTEFLGAKKE